MQLQLHTQYNQAVQIAHTDSLRSLAESTKQRNLTIYLQSYLHKMDPIKKDFLSG